MKGNVVVYLHHGGQSICRSATCPDAKCLIWCKEICGSALRLLGAYSGREVGKHVVLPLTQIDLG
jgi:hypothetical protein